MSSLKNMNQRSMKKKYVYMIQNSKQLKNYKWSWTSHLLLNNLISTLIYIYIKNWHDNFAVKL